MGGSCQPNARCGRIPKDIMNGELEKAQRLGYRATKAKLQGCPQKRPSDINLQTWELSAIERTAWRQEIVHAGVKYPPLRLRELMRRPWRIDTKPPAGQNATEYRVIEVLAVTPKLDCLPTTEQTKVAGHKTKNLN